MISTRFLKYLFLVMTFGLGIYFFHSHKVPVIQDTSVLLVGTSDDYPPYTFNENGVIVGFDIDLAYAVAERLGKKCEIKSMNFSVLLLELNRGTVAMLAAGITPRKTAFNVLFTDPYLAGDPFLVISLNPLKTAFTIQDLYTKTVVVNEGYTSDFFLSQYPEIKLVRLETVAECILALKTKKADLFVVAQTVMDPFFTANPSVIFAKTILKDLTESYAFVLSQHKKELFDQVQQALIDLKADGTIEILKKKWKLL